MDRTEEKDRWITACIRGGATETERVRAQGQEGEEWCSIQIMAGEVNAESTKCSSQLC